jgi:hypothetical protein
MIKIGDYDTIMSDHNIFNQVVYTPLSEAVKILKERQQDKNLIAEIDNLLGENIPEPLKKMDLYGISGKQVATPNFDTRWFIELTKVFGLKTFFSEYHSDKFTSNNYFKHSLGQLLIHSGLNKKEDYIEEKITIVDFNKYNGKPIRDVLTLWGQPLIDFHKNLFSAYGFDTEKFIFYDCSNWLKNYKGGAKDYYKKDQLIYICHGILFENFLLTGDDGKFTRDIFLPAFEEAYNLTGVKPLIVPIPPMDAEEGSHWFSYDKKVKLYIK